MAFRRWPNKNGGAAAVHPSDTHTYLRDGIGFQDGSRAVVTWVEREAYVDVIHFNFVDFVDFVDTQTADVANEF